MKKISKRMISMLVLMSVLLTLISATELPNQSTETMSENTAIQEVLEAYFDARLLVFQEDVQQSVTTATEQSIQSTLNEINVSASVKALELQRTDATENLKKLPWCISDSSREYISGDIDSPKRKPCQSIHIGCI